MDFGGGKKKKKGGAAPAQKAPEPEEVDETTPYKGKPSSFFVMATNMAMQSDTNPFGYELNKDQWNFVFKYHPEYAASPYEMLIWIYQQALIKEEAEAAFMEQYAKPS